MSEILEVNQPNTSEEVESQENLLKNKYIPIFEKLYNGKYDYSESVYINARTPIAIRCKIHGVFHKICKLHKNGQGCPKCAQENRKKLSTEEVIAAFNFRHKYKYDYSEVHYVRGDKKVKIKCKKHGIFEQTPNAHKNGQGCPKCSGRGKTKSEIIDEFNELHEFKYDYSLMDFVCSTQKVKIKCKDHGVFEITPNAHLQGIGCKFCKE
jgi:uncharacterized protein YxeA